MTSLQWFIAAEDGLLRGNITDDRITVAGTAPSLPLNYLTADWERGRIYASARYDVCAFEVTESGPRLLYQAPCRGDVACHVCLSPDRNFLFCANYISGNVSIFRIHDDRFEFVQSISGQGHCGSNKIRQDGPHAHYCTFIDGNLWTVDLGQDAIFIFPWDGKKLSREIQQIHFPSGTGPRHLVHDRNRELVYCASELTCEVFVIGQHGLKLSAGPSVGDHPDDALSAIRLSPDGNTIGTGIRGSDRIAFLDAETMQVKEKFCCKGRCIRDFEFITDSILCVCFQDSGEISFFRKEKTWKCFHSIQVPSPMCVLLRAAISKVLKNRKENGLF